MEVNEIMVAIVSAIIYLCGGFMLRKKQITQQLFFVFVYLIGLTLVSHMTILLPIYFIVSLIPFLFLFRRASKFTLFLMLYFSAYFIIGIMAQDSVAAITAFVGKLWQFLIFFLVLDTVHKQEEISLAQLVASVIVECALGMYLLHNGRMNLATETVRLVSGAQPISGNIAIVVLPLIVYLYFKYKGISRIETKIIIISTIFLFWIIRSGTRGYMLIYALTMCLIVYDYFLGQKIRTWNTKINRFFILMFMIVTFVFVVLSVPNILDKFLEVTRFAGSLNESLGIRTFENKAEIDFFINAPWYTELFGIGLGGTAGDYSAYTDAISTQLSLGMWQGTAYLYEPGVRFHNLYANILLTLGGIGLIITVVANIVIWKRISWTCRNNYILCRIFHLYQIGFMLMNYYRWSGDCGIAEMIIFALVLKSISKDKFNIKKVE